MKIIIAFLIVLAAPAFALAHGQEGKPHSHPHKTQQDADK